MCFEHDTRSSEICSKIAKFRLFRIARIITGDEMWLHGCDVETKVSQWKRPKKSIPKEAR